LYRHVRDNLKVALDDEDDSLWDSLIRGEWIEEIDKYTDKIVKRDKFLEVDELNINRILECLIQEKCLELVEGENDEYRVLKSEFGNVLEFLNQEQIDAISNIFRSNFLIKTRKRS
jgi:hypothetical protein